MNKPFLNISELDYQDIKAALISYLKNSENNNLTGADFEGSSLNSLISLLAYNTHYNAVLANLAVNEAFLDSAQQRASVVSHAKLVGYTPRSATCARAYAKLFGMNSTAPAIGSTFSAIANGDSRTFVLRTNLNSLRPVVDADSPPLIDGDAATYCSDTIVELVAGTPKEEIKFISDLSVNDFTILDRDVDTSTIEVIVSEPGQNPVTYSRFSDISGIDSNSTVYYITENTLGEFQIRFGDGVIGHKPTVKSKVTIKYISSNKDLGNGASTFSLKSANLLAVASDVIPGTSKSSNGRDREELDSIRFNAPLSFIAQNRAVTVDDYVTFLQNNPLVNLTTLSVWGGEDNEPKTYGDVYICGLKSENNLLVNLSSNDKLVLKEYLKPKQIIGVDTKFVDAGLINVILTVSVLFNKNKSLYNSETLKRQILELFTLIDSTELNKFNSSIYTSVLSKRIMDLDPAIHTVDISGSLRKEVTNNLQIQGQNTVATSIIESFGCPIVWLSLGEPSWANGTRRLVIRDTEIRIVDDKDQTIEVVGSIDYQTGSFSISGTSKFSEYPGLSLTATAIPLDKHNFSSNKSNVLKLNALGSSVTITHRL